MCRSTGRTAETPPDAGIAAGEDATIAGAVAHGDDPFRGRRRLVGALERFAHVRGDRARHEEHIGVTRRRDEAQAESLEIVEDVVERMDLELATVAGARIHFADRKRSAQAPPCGAVDLRGELGQRRFVRDRRRFGQRPVDQTLEQHPTHGRLRYRSWPE